MKTRFDYYQFIRRTHPDLFYTTKLQHQMRQEQKQMGNAFFTTRGASIFHQFGHLLLEGAK
jgi:hypothetical protein